MKFVIQKRKMVQSVAGIALVVSVLGVPSSLAAEGATKTSGPVVVRAIGAENEYANVIQQIGGRFVSVMSVMSNPNTDPHTYEASAKTANLVAGATLIAQNGVGYDNFMNKLESAASNRGRTIIDVQQVLGLPDTIPNPHLWYKQGTMPKVAQQIANALAKDDPSEASYFYANLKQFDQSLRAWDTAIARVNKSYKNTPVATSELVADYLLQELGLINKTPWSFQMSVQNGTDPSPQDVQIQETLLKKHQVKVFVYDQQVVDSLTTTLKNLAKANHIPVVGVYETMPLHQTYQTWMLNETKDIEKALKYHLSTETIP